VNLWELEGIHYAQLDSDENFEAQTGSNPTSVPNLSVAAGDFAGNVTSSVYVLVKLVYRTKLWGLITQAAS